jgi:hypothetical protein
MSVPVFDAILILAALVMISRVFVPWGERATGNIVQRRRLSLLGRLRMHGHAALVLFIGSVAALVLGWIHPLTLLAVITVLVVLLTLPITYLLTSRGIRAGWTPFRRWTEFGGVVRRPGGVRLQGVAGARPLDVWLSGDTDDDNFVLLLRQLVRGSYKGQLGPETDVAAPAPVQLIPVGMAQSAVGGARA